MEAPSEEDIADTMSAFATKDPEMRLTVEMALRVLPATPRSTLYSAIPGDAVRGRLEWSRSGVPEDMDSTKLEVVHQGNVAHAEYASATRLNVASTPVAIIPTKAAAARRIPAANARATTHAKGPAVPAAGRCARLAPAAAPTASTPTAATTATGIPAAAAATATTQPSVVNAWATTHAKGRAVPAAGRCARLAPAAVPTASTPTVATTVRGIPAVAAATASMQPSAANSWATTYAKGPAVPAAGRCARLAPAAAPTTRTPPNARAAAPTARIPPTLIAMARRTTPRVSEFGVHDQAACRDHAHCADPEMAAAAAVTPLVFHDLHLVRASRAMDGSGLKLSLSDAITSMLQAHPGPIPYFRLDSFVIRRGCDQIEEWMDILSRKDVEEVVIVNSRWPAETVEFPLQSLDSRSLKVLRLCFFTMPYIWLPTHDSSPIALDLTGCSITEGDLWALIKQCKRLKQLYIGLREDADVRIDSESLELLLIWWSTVPYLIIENAPSLKKLTVGATKRRTTKLTWINIRGAHRLQHVWFNLCSQIFTVNRVTLGQGNITFSDLRTLELTIAYKSADQRKSLFNFLKSCPYLRILIIWRADEPSKQEDIDVITDDTFAQLKQICCVRSHLEVLSLKQYKGGSAENAIASSVLEHAAVLQTLNIETGTGNPESRVLIEKAQQIFQC